MKKIFALLFSTLLVAALGCGLAGCTHSSTNTTNTANSANVTNTTNASNASNAAAANNANTAANAAKTNTATSSSNLTFRSYSLMKEHYEKHGVDMGFSSMEDYLAAANAVVANPDSLHKTESEDGDDIYYLESTNEIVFVSTDGYIRTYFCPDSGKKYYDKQ